MAAQWQTRFEQSEGRQTVSYAEGMDFYEKLARTYPQTIRLVPQGLTDSGLPLHTVVFSYDGNFDPGRVRAQNRPVWLINNAIHAGEPDGVEATRQLMLALAQNPELARQTVVVAIPFYNIGGVLNRSQTTRVNQNGPEAYGFRGNARYFDLNRDFIKADSRNALSFAQIFHTWQPQLFLDTHVSNGADYQHVMTYIATQADKLGGPMGHYLRHFFIPQLEQKMTDRQFPMCPYVNAYGRNPFPEGYPQFYDLPRYSSGYTALFACLGFIAETHMLKPFVQRVAATYALMRSMLEMSEAEGAKLTDLQKQQYQSQARQDSLDLDWEVRKDTARRIAFAGYASCRIPSRVTTGERLFYDRSQPVQGEIPFYEFFRPIRPVQKPVAYIIPQAWTGVLERLQANGVQGKRLRQDQQIPVEVYFIENYQTLTAPFEGHYLHFNTQVRSENQSLAFQKGDYMLWVNQPAGRYLVETLEPTAPDSFFNWNFFDIILQQKEGYSDYVFEDLAEQLLKENASLRAQFARKMQEDQAFAQNPEAQLEYIYQHSIHREPGYRRYPVFRLHQELPLATE
ncbi:MAG: M14 family metallopeptidase [Microscillaceae bacterium]